jgi:DNA polymerase III epsilon subunit family exonuclease
MPFSLVQPICDIPIACIDVETSGASAELGERVIEVGIVRYENGRQVAQYEQLIDPQRRISAGVTPLTGISQAMCAGRPTFAQQFHAMMQFLGGAAILGHNIPFDLGFLAREFRRAGHDLAQMLADAPILDTVRIARRRFGRGGNGLSSLARRLGCEPEVAHRALADARTTGIIFDRLLGTSGWLMCLCDVYLQQGGPMRLPSSSSRISVLPWELEEALEMGHPIEMEYLDARQMRTRRVINPIEIRRASGELVLIAHCHLRNDRRHFKVQRIVALSRIDVTSATV